jgi:glyoxylase-like metal-dependent hydrolase (beta-lactamase superfamily II)
MVDTGTAAMSDKVIAAVQSLAKGRPLRYIINTSHRDEYTGGNDKLAPTVKSFRFASRTTQPARRAPSTRIARRSSRPSRC